MKSQKMFLSVLYLLVYSSFSTAKLSPALVTQVDKGIDTSVKLAKCMDEIAKWASKAEETEKTIEKVLKVFDALAKLASALSFVGALVGFIFAFIPKYNPVLEFMKVQFSEVNRKLDSITLQISSLAKEMEWAAYASVYSNDENNIKTSWIKLREFIDSAAEAETQQEKTRLAERFTTFYENAGTEKSVYNFYSYLTENNPASLNKNLLVLVTEKSKGNFKTLVQFTSYFTSLMVTGLQLNLYYYMLKGYNRKPKAEEAVSQLTDVRTKIQDILIECADNFEVWAEKDVQEIGTQPLPDKLHLAYRIKEHLEKKFSWYEWTVIVHDKKDAEETTYGNSFKVVAQDKVVIHVLHREKGFTVNEGIKTAMENEWESKEKLCKNRLSTWPAIFQITTMKHVEYIHELSEYDQTVDNAHIKLLCADRIEYVQNQVVYIDWRTFTIYLKSKELAQNDPFSDVNCNKGQCRQIKDASSGMCKCDKMFYGPTCQGSVQDDIDFATIENEVIDILFQPVPDMTTIYYDLQDMKKYAEDAVKTLRQDIQRTQIFVKYIDVIEKFRYLAKVHGFLKNETMTPDEFVSEVQALFTKSSTFLYMLHKFDLMMQGTGFGDKSNILDILRESLLTALRDKDGQTISHSVEACSESYRKKVDYFVRMMFSFEKEAFLGWQRYQLEQKNLVTSKDLSSVSGTQEYRSNKDGDSMAIFKQYVSQQWSLFNKNGCGPLKAEHLSNMYCEKPYHSTDQQEVPLTCESIGHFRPLGGPSRRFPPGQHEPRQPFPVTVKCSKGRWSALPVCYTDPAGGSTTCATKSGATVCTASCLSGRTFADGQTTDTYRCTTQPCPSFNPRACDRCATNSACGNSEVCSNGKCVDGCSVYSCGVNAQCTTSRHVQSCSCVHPWVVWKNEQPHTEGCRYKDLQWMDRSMHDRIPGNAVKSQAGHHVCRATGPDDGWHGGWIWIHEVNTCNYEYAWSEKRADKYQVLVDPCGGSGVTWDSGRTHVDAVEIGQAIPWPSITYLVCSVDSNGVPGKLFETRSGFKCHYGYEGKGDRADSFKSLVKKPCV
ncbi:hypothetical protein GJAV_G00071370 [Gymnothorax javanicus]|nr:hypothetical protein GJAV_G00071370 [Gymnothorax javanicus]